MRALERSDSELREGDKFVESIGSLTRAILGICGKLLCLQEMELEKRSQERLESPIIRYGISSIVLYDQLKDWLKTTSFVKVSCSSNPKYFILFT